MPAPLALAVHAAIADPVYVSLAEHVTVVVELAFVIANVFVSVEPSWFASPSNVAVAVAVPTLVLFE
jgi:hypothetical protein